MDYLPNLGENLLRQLTLHQDVPGLHARQEARPRPVRVLELRRVLGPRHLRSQFNRNI